MAKRKSAREKIDGPDHLPQIKPAPANWGGGSMVIVHPREVEAVMKKVRRGKVITLDEIRANLAEKHGADICCAMTAGIFVNLAALAAEEARDLGRKRITPYWRTLKRNGELNLKFPGGPTVQAALLEAEGHTISKKRKKYFVVEYERRLQKLC